MPSLLSSAARLRSQKETVLNRWLGMVREALPAAYGQSEPALLNSIPIFLDHLIEALSSQTTVSNANDDNVISSEHGFQRANLGTYNPEQIMQEYRLLEDAVFEAIENEGHIPGAERKIVANSFHTATLEAVCSFTSSLDSKRTQAESTFQLLVQEIRDYAIFMIDPDGIVVNWNEGASRIKGYKAEEVIGQYYGMLYLKEDYDNGRPARNLRLAYQDGRHQEQWWRRRKDGTAFWADVTITAVYDSTGKHLGFSKVIKDLTEKKRADEALRTAKEAAEAANEMKSAFLANMSHEIRTPLGAILGFAEMLSEPKYSEEEKQAHREIIERNGRVLTRLIDDILDLSKVEAGKLAIQYLEVPLRSLISEIAGIVELSARKKGIEVLTSVSENVPNKIVSDPVRLRQILNNVAGNAVKFTDSGHVHIKADYERTQNGAQAITIRIEDTGPGIPHELRDRLFKPFAQADESTTRRFGGTGLGLALSRKLARELGGDIEIVDCPVDIGCVFEITIADRAQRYLSTVQKYPKPPAEAPKSPVTSIRLDHVRVLLVEDSKDNQILISRLLAKAGAMVELASNGAEGVDKAQEEDFEIVLMDIQMPVLDGLTATRKLRASGYTGPIIALTAHAMMEQKMRCLEAGCTDHLTKPINSGELIAKISNYANDQRQLIPSV